ncbi:hypothetical protein AB0B94_18985 [Micromonospora sp. NPDC048986]|uniref:hypothetical protein n=1 Tax=Micromonospora sp. NPDC048986 TaxID=3155644 RepID=UPI0033E92BE1
MDAVVQWVRTSWTKRSRGDAEATRRNAVPVSFVLPERAVPFVQEITMSEAVGFERLDVAEPMLEAITSPFPPVRGGLDLLRRLRVAGALRLARRLVVAG